jgi:hypothetical protein
LFILVGIAACGADNTDGITFTTNGVPALFDAKLDDGAWQTYAPKQVVDGNAVYNIATFLSTIDAVFVCESTDGTFDAREIRTTDAKDLGASCDVTVDRDQLAVTLSGANPRAFVDVDSEEKWIDNADGEVVFLAPKPSTDILVHDASHFAVQRAIDTGDGPNEISIDLTTAPPPRFGHYTWDPLEADETFVFPFCDYATNSAYARFPFQAAGDYPVLDDSLVATNDIWSAQLIVSSATSERLVELLDPDPSTTPVMHWLPRITGTIDPTTMAATFDGFDIEYGTLFVGCNAHNSFESLGITRAYRDARVDDLHFEEGVPGWRWTLETDHRGCGAGVSTADAEVYAQTSFN